MTPNNFDDIKEGFSLFDNSPIPSLCITEYGSIIHANHMCRSLFENKVESLVDRPLVTSIAPKDRRLFNAFLSDLKDGGPAKAELEFKSRFGKVIHTLFEGVPVFEGANFQFSIVSIIDVSEQKLLANSFDKVKDELQYLAHHDSLTNLPNRYLLDDRLSTAMSRIKRSGWMGAVVFIDVDRFKIINDDYGHHVGDEVLIEVSNRLRFVVRDQDTVCRFSGDEFIIVLEEITCKKDAEIVVEKIIDAFCEPIFELIEQPLTVSTSIGVFVFDKNDKDPDQIIRKADYAMYESKKRGRNSYTFYSYQHELEQSLSSVYENDLVLAIEQNEFRLNFQPQINAKTNEIETIEVLTRWNHKHQGIIQPKEFLHKIENANLSSNLTIWVLENACMTAKSWLDQGMAFNRIAINVTPKEFTSLRLIEHVEQALEKSGLPPNKLEIELTESSIVQNPSMAEKMLWQFEKMGITLALDDFGTGFSALSSLNEFPFHNLKIDKSFVDKLNSNSKSESLINAIIAMANSLNLNVVAEGVESEMQRDYLLEQGCHLMQGFYFYEPMKPEDIEQLLLVDNEVNLKKII